MKTSILLQLLIIALASPVLAASKKLITHKAATTRVSEVLAGMKKSKLQPQAKLKELHSLRIEVSSWIDRTPKAKFTLAEDAIQYVYGLNSVIRRIEPIYEKRMLAGECAEVADDIATHALNQAAQGAGVQDGLKVVELVCSKP